MNDQSIEQQRGDLVLSTDRRRIDVARVLGWLHESHWGKSMTRAKLERAIEHSVCVSVYRGTEQLGFLRAITDLATYAYFTDVIVADDARRQGIGSWMVEATLSHPDLQGLRRFALWTRDAPWLYEKFGFQEICRAAATTAATAAAAGSTYMELRPGRR